MKITVKWIDQSKYPQFNLMIASAEGKDPFVEIKGCRIVTGKDGEFVSGPSTKGKNDKYWNHVYFSKEFSAVVLKLAKESQPKQAAPTPKPAPAKGGGFDDFDVSDDIPF